VNIFGEMDSFIILSSPVKLMDKSTQEQVAQMSAGAQLLK
jgi:hypothetical protein